MVRTSSHVHPSSPSTFYAEDAFPGLQHLAARLALLCCDCLRSRDGVRTAGRRRPRLGRRPRDDLREPSAVHERAGVQHRPAFAATDPAPRAADAVLAPGGDQRAERAGGVDPAVGRLLGVLDRDDGWDADQWVVFGDFDVFEGCGVLIRVFCDSKVGLNGWVPMSLR